MCINLYISSKCILLARCIWCLVKSVELKAFFASYVKHDSESMLTSNDIEYNKVWETWLYSHKTCGSGKKNGLYNVCCWQAWYYYVLYMICYN